MGLEQCKLSTGRCSIVWEVHQTKFCSKLGEGLKVNFCGENFYSLDEICCCLSMSKFSDFALFLDVSTLLLNEIFIKQYFVRIFAFTIGQGVVVCMEEK